MNTSQSSTENPARKLIRDAELLRLLLQGFNIPQCAEMMKSTAGTVRKYCRDPQFLLQLREHSGEIATKLVEELATSQVEMAQRLEEASGRALEEMLVMMNELQGASKLKMNICQDLLDRDPKSARSKRMELAGVLGHEFINPALLIHAAAAAKEIERSAVVKGVIDVNVEPSADHSTGS